MWPWVLNVPEEPVPPPEPSRPEDYWTIEEEEEPTAILADISSPLEATQQIVLEDSMEFESLEEKLAFEKHILAIDKAKPHDLRNSHKFELRKTRGNVIPRDS